MLHKIATVVLFVMAFITGVYLCQLITEWYDA